MTPPSPKPWRDHLRATLTLALPLSGSHLAQNLTHVVDALMLGRYEVEALAAAVLAGTLFFEFFIVGSGFALAVMPLAANAEGAGDVRAVRRVVRMGLWLSLGYAVLSLPALWHTEAILTALGQEARIAARAQDYMRFAMWGMIPALGVMALKSFASALERAKVVLWVTLLSTAVNAVLNYALIFGHWGAPEMGLEGAALASVISQLVALGAIGAWARLPAAQRRYELFVRVWRPDWAALAEVFRLGWPIGITLLAESGLFFASAILMGWLGTAPLAAHGIAIQLASLAFMVHLGLSNAATVRVGRARGAGDVPNLLRAALSAGAVSLLFALCVVALFVSLPEPLVRLFLDATDPQAPRIVEIGVALLFVAALFQIADGAQALALGALRGLADARLPMILAAISYWGIGIPVSYWLGIRAGFGGPGVWFGLVVGLGLAGITLSLRFAWLARAMRAHPVAPARK